MANFLLLLFFLVQVHGFFILILLLGKPLAEKILYFCFTPVFVTHDRNKVIVNSIELHTQLIFGKQKFQPILLQSLIHNLLINFQVFVVKIAKG